jgi:hypothetical protein
MPLKAHDAVADGALDMTATHSRPTLRRRCAALGLTVGLVVLAGCGGSSGGSSSSSSAGPLTQAEFVSQANAACHTANAALEAMTAPGNTLPDVGAFTAKVEPFADALTSSLSKLTPPTADQALWTKYLADNKAGDAELSALATAADASDTAGAEAASNKLTALSDDSIATKLGLTQCAIDAQPKGS